MLFEQQVYKVCNKIKNKENIKPSEINNVVNKLKDLWLDIMVTSGLYNKLNKTYSLNNIEVKPYGFKLQILIVPPLTFDKLESNLCMLEENLGCMVILNHSKASRWINAKFIFNQEDKKEFKIVKQKDIYNIFICNDYSGNSQFSDLRKYPHVLVTGTTRSGKSKLADCALTNLICNSTPQEVNLILIQVAKSDLILYEDVEHTIAFADTLEKTKVILKYVVEVMMVERSNILKPYKKKSILDNIHEYNNLKKCQNTFPMIVIAFDEMASLFQTKGNNSETKAIKEEISSYIESIAQYGASLSIFLFSSLQRPTKDFLPPFVKAMSNTLISLRQANEMSSMVATDNPKLATELKQRELVYNLDYWDYGIIPLVDNKKIYEYLKPYLKPNHRTLFDDIEKMNSRNGVKKDKELIEVGTHIKTENEILKENISKINNFIPYQNPTGLIIRDETKPSIKTQKPIKEGRVKIK